MSLHENTKKETLDEAVNYFNKLSETFKICASGTNDEKDKIWYLAKAEAYELAAFEIVHNVL